MSVSFSVAPPNAFADIVFRCWIIVLLALPGSLAFSQSPSVKAAPKDVLVMTRPGSGTLSRRKGEIQQWQGRTITMMIGSREREFDSDRIVALETEWSPEFTNAKTLKASGKTSEAAEQLVKAVNDETRVWAKHIIRAELMDAYLLLGKPASSVQQFRLILSKDPNTRFINQMPLPWENRFATVPGADEWMASDNSATRLLGASWSLATPKREQAIKTLGDLAADLDPRIRDLATAQLWRTRSRPNAKLVQHWQKIVEEMDRENRAGALFVLAEAQQKVGDSDAAILSLMKVISLHETQSALVAASLKKIASVVESGGDGTSKSKRVSPDLFLAELQNRFPESVWAK